jgi:protein-S-isoprenylcysteine O-methyltransferase Ste14
MKPKIWAVTVCLWRFEFRKKNTDERRERARFLQHEDAKPWDKVLAPLVGLGGGLIPLVAGLDELLGWSPAFSLPVKIIALVLIVAGYALGAYALIENRFFSGMVRLQTDRDQQVVSSGPYAWIRHPGYAGALLSYLGMPLHPCSYKKGKHHEF